MAPPIVAALMFGIILLFPLLCASWLLRPLKLSFLQKNVVDKTKIALSDMFALPLLVTFPIVVVNLVEDNFNRRPLLQGLVYVSNGLAMTLIWWIGVRILSKLSVDDWKLRTGFLCVSMPCAALGGFSLEFLVGIAVVSIYDAGQTDRHLQIGLATLYFLLWALWMFAGRLLVRWVDRESQNVLPVSSE
jgi:flagellar biosynthesis protein FliR